MAVDLPNIRNITVSGRIGTGASTLASGLAEKLSWQMLDGGKLFRKLSQEMGFPITQTLQRPDKFDLEYEERVKNMLKNETHQIVQSHLAGYDAQGIEGVFKILLICEDKDGNDMSAIRVDRLVNRDGASVADAKYEVTERERQHLEKFRKLYAGDDPNWVYWDKKYYNLVINTYSLNQEEALQLALQGVGYTH